MRCLKAIAIVLVIARPAGAIESWMDETAIREAFAGKTIQGNYASGKAFTEIYRADGSIEYRERGVEYRGHWSLQAGTFCTIYHSDPTGGCYQVRQVSSNCYEFYFVARTEEQAANEGPGRLGPRAPLFPTGTQRARISRAFRAAPGVFPILESFRFK